MWQWLQSVRGVAETVLISCMGCVGLAICATTIRGVLLTLSQNVQNVAELAPISFRGYVGLATCVTTTRGVRLRLSQIDEVRLLHMHKAHL